MAADILFHRCDPAKSSTTTAESFDANWMQNSRLLNTDLAELRTYAAEKYQLSIPVLGEPVVEGRTRMEVDRYGGCPGGRRADRWGDEMYWATLDALKQKGAKALSETVDQVLGYLAWRDTECAILLFNRNRNFPQVPVQVKPTLEQHAQFVTFEGSRDETEMSFTFKRADDPDRRFKLSVLAFDIPTEDA